MFKVNGILKTRGEKMKEPRKKKVVFNASHITAAFSASPKTSVFWKGVFLRQMSGHEPEPFFSDRSGTTGERECKRQFEEQ